LKDLRANLLLWGLAGVVVVVYGALGYYVFQSRRPVASSPETAFTAQIAYPLAEGAAKEWRDDAYLLSATAAWSQNTEKGLREGKTSWAFYFLSPLARQIRVFSVTPEEVAGTRTMDALSIPSGIDLSRWQVDSPEVIRLFLKGGGQGFLDQHPDASLHLRLAADEEGRLVWMASSLSSGSTESLSVVIDTQTGEVIG